MEGMAGRKETEMPGCTGLQVGVRNGVRPTHPHRLLPSSHRALEKESLRLKYMTEQDRGRREKGDRTFWRVTLSGLQYS